jgi:predicted alpha/beta-fold hydrolase
MHFAGLGGSQLRTPRAYSSAATDDLSVVVRTLQHEEPLDTIYYAVGISMGMHVLIYACAFACLIHAVVSGSMILTKYMAEQGDMCPFIGAW